MSTLAEIVQQCGPAYQARYAERMLPSHWRTLQDIATCRTPVQGGHVYYCEHCEETHYQYHSCQNRHCPQCQHRQGQVWLDKQTAALLPVPYFMVTFTLPSALHAMARQHQAVIFGLLFRASAEALQELAGDPRYVGGKIGMVGVLHTWGRMLTYHPHIHYLVPGGGLSNDGQEWLSARRTFFVPVKALSILFRAKFRDALKKTGLFEQVPAAVWQQAWVTHCKSVGKGYGALRYLAPYIFRVAISNRRILKVVGEQVTFRYRPSGSNRCKICTLSAAEFLRRFLQHVLPKGFVKVRYYGLLSPGYRYLLPYLHALLPAGQATPDDCPQAHKSSGSAPQCPTCGHPMRWVLRLRPRSRCPPAALLSPAA